MNLKIIFLALLVIFALFPVLLEKSYAGTPAGTITYSAGTDTITVIGANSSHPAEFLDLYNADVAGGWGQVTMLGSNQFYFDCRIMIGNAVNATYFADTKKMIQFAVGAVYNNYVFVVQPLGEVTLGTGDNVNKIGKDGCSFVHLATSGTYRFGSIAPPEDSSHVYLYGCTFWTLGVGLELRADKIYNCELHNAVYIPNIYHSGEIYYTTSTTNYLGFQFYVNATVSNIYSFGNTNGIYFYAQSGSSFSIKNAKLINNAKAVYFDQITAVKSFYMINADVDVWSLTFNNSPNATLYRQNEFDLYVLNGALTDFVEDANVTLTHDGVVFGSWLTNSTGQIDTQTLTYGFYNQTGGDTMYGGTAWTLTVTHPDWETYTSTFYPYSEIDWSISMQDTTTSNNNMLLSGLMVGVLCFAGFIVYIKRGNQ